MSTFVKSQNIYTALQLNQEREYKTVRPKKIIEYNTFYNSSSKDTYKNVKTFDHAGMILTEERFDETGNLSAKLTYINDTLNRLKLSRTFERWNKLGYSSESATYKYENKALISITDTHINGNRIGLSEMTNNGEGYPIAVTVYDRNGNLIGKELATYFYQMNTVITTVFNQNDQILSSDTLKISLINASKFPFAKEIYNDHGDLTSGVRKNYNGSENILNEEYIYDPFGNCKEDKIYLLISTNKRKPKKVVSSIFKKEYTY